MEGIERRHTKNEGLVRMCACRGTAGFVHLSCLVRQAQSAMDDELSNEDMNSKFSRWYDCRLCHQRFQGLVLVALGWACWKTHAGPWESTSRQEFSLKHAALNQLAASLSNVDRDAEALSLFEELLVVVRRAFDLGLCHKGVVVDCQTNIAGCLNELDRTEEALAMRKNVYSQMASLLGAKHPNILADANNLAQSLVNSPDHVAEGLKFLREQKPIAESALGPADDTTLKLRWKLGRALMFSQDEVTSADCETFVEAEAVLVETVARARQVLGERYPLTMRIDAELGRVRYVLAQAKFQTVRIGNNYRR